MKNYLTNLWLWLTGYTRLGTLVYKPGWGPLLMLIPYTLDHGTHVLCGGACETWSRWAYVHREHYAVAKFIDRLMNHLDADHGANSGGTLWGTVDSWRPRYQVMAALGWVLLLVVGNVR